MSSYQCSFLKSDELQVGLRPLWFEIRRYTNECRPTSQVEDQKLLQDAMGLIFRGELFADWDPKICDAWLDLGCSLARRALDQIYVGDSAASHEGVLRLTDQLSAMTAIVAEKVSSATRLNVCGAWVRARILKGMNETDNLDSLCREVTENLSWVALPPHALEDCVRCEFVIRIARTDSPAINGDSHRAWAVTWCTSLVQKPSWRTRLADSAIALGVSLPADEDGSSKETLDTKEEGESETRAVEMETNILGRPTVFDEATLEQERQDLLFDLTAYALGDTPALKAKTSEQVTHLDPSAPASEMKVPFYFAASDLWNGYWTRGEEQLLALAERVALYVYSYAVLHKGGERDAVERSNSLHAWMFTQFPRKLLTCTVSALLVDASRLCAATGTRRNDLSIRQGIIQAFAGVCRMLEKQGDGEGREQIIKSYGQQLRAIHDEYLAKAEEVGVQPREEELDAWDSLRISSPEPRRGDAINSILEDADFKKVINRGATEETYQFACINKQKIQEILERRLNVRLGLEFLMEPKLLIYDPKSRERGALDPSFATAKEALRIGEYGRAAVLFDRLAPRLQGTVRNIARDYQAYALAKDGKQMPARLELDQVCREEFYSPSAYWNLACCQLPEDMDQQLETLVSGLKHAPHPQLLHGATYLGLFLNDARVREWLPCLTYAEALLLFYRLEYEQAELSSQQKQDHVLRLGRYAVEGELPVPDPLQDGLPVVQVRRFMNGLLERKQPAAFDFWLRCRELISTNRYTHWEAKADFLEKTGRKLEAAKAFEAELQARLRYYGILARKNDRRRSTELLHDTRRRLDMWLGLCWPDLKNIGFDLYNMAKNFEKQYVLNMVPNRLRKTYDTDEASSPPPLPQQPQPPPPPENVSQTLTTVGAECQSRLRELSDLPSVRWHLDSLIEVLRRASSPGSADGLGLLLQQWESYNRLTVDTERQAGLLRAHTAYSDLRRHLQKELTDQQWSLASPFMSACKRVNESLARDAKLLPQFTVEGSAGGMIEVDSSSPKTAFGIRVRCSGGGGAAVRLKGATATLDDAVTIFPLRDRLEEIETCVSPTETCVLTFDIALSLDLSKPRAVQIVLAFEYASGEYNTSPITLQIVQRTCPSLPSDSPYISGRPLEATEIDGHFFGRTKEQEAIFESIRDGQQRLRYVCGIRRTGKSSLLNSIEYEVGKRSLPLIPVYFSAGEVKGLSDAGKFLFNFLNKISTHPAIAEKGILPPTEERCCENMPLAFSAFVRHLADRIPERRVLVLLDDFQNLIEAAAEADSHNRSFATGVAGLLNIIYANANPRARILWVLAGHRTKEAFTAALPGADLWGTLRELQIDFLDRQSVREIVTQPLKDSGVRVPEETVSLLYRETAGHPEIVQKVAEFMLLSAMKEMRWTITPADVHSAVRNLALHSSDDPFAIAWYPEGELSEEQDRLMVELVKKAPVGGRIDPSKLVAPRALTDRDTTALADLKARKILDEAQDGTIGVRAYVLDLWLHKMLKDVQHRTPDSPAIFVDVANLTAGKGSSTLSGLETTEGEGLPGQFSLKTVLATIEAYVYRVSPVPVAAHWAVNYPQRCPAVLECNAKGYRIVNIPDYLWQKAQASPGSDDTVLMETITEVQTQFPNVKHFVLVLGDKDYRVKVDKLLQNGKHVHIVSRASALGNPNTKHSYDYLAKKYPDRFSLKRLEELLEGERKGASRTVSAR